MRRRLSRATTVEFCQGRRRGLGDDDDDDDGGSGCGGLLSSGRLRSLLVGTSCQVGYRKSSVSVSDSPRGAVWNDEAELPTCDERQAQPGLGARAFAAALAAPADGMEEAGDEGAGRAPDDEDQRFV